MNKKRSPWPEATIAARPWTDIEAHYLDWEEGKELLDVVRHWRTDGTVKRLYAYTSMHWLVISLYEQINPHWETLHIRWSGSQWELIYYARPDIKPEFTQCCSPGTLHEKINAFLKNIRW